MEAPVGSTYQRLADGASRGRALTTGERGREGVQPDLSQAPRGSGPRVNGESLPAAVLTGLLKRDPPSGPENGDR